MEQKTLTNSKDLPIISREALLSLVEWVKIRRQQDERTISGDPGAQDEHSGRSQNTDHRCVGPDDQSAPDGYEQSRGTPGKEGE